MSYDILTIPPFDKQLKRLAKKYPSIKTDFSNLLESLEVDPVQGAAIGKNCYKIRMSIKSKNKGKSGGARVITNFVISEETVFLLTVYDKSNKKNLTNKELEELLQFVSE